MKNILIILTILFLFTGFMPLKESFEGFITYKITYIPRPGNEDYTKHQAQKLGSELKLTFFKNGNFKREYPLSGLIFGTDFSIYMQSVNRLYTKMRNNDTIKASDCSKNTLIQKEESEKPAEVINGTNCPAYYISGNDVKTRQINACTYYYPLEKEFIDWKLFSGYNDLFYNKVVFKMQAPFYKLIVDQAKYTTTFELVKIEAKKLTEDLLKFPKAKPVKEL